MLARVELLNDNKAPKIPAAIEYLRTLQSRPCSAALTQFLIAFAQPKEISSTTLSEGVKRFISIANLDPQQRHSFYGDAFAGLHYNNDLTHLWNKRHEESIQAHELNLIAPTKWNFIHQEGSQLLVYKGNKPSEALNELLQGPTVIDCGMFCQLSLWFGIRYMLGDERFDKIFGNTPLYITQLNYQPISNLTKPGIGNPLFDFTSSKDEVTTSVISIEHIANSFMYQMKHPGGNYGGENCIVIDGIYHIFDPHLVKKEGLTKSEINQLLLNVFNQEPTDRDAERIALFAKSPDEQHHELGLSFGALIAMAEALKDKILTQEEFSQESKTTFAVNFNLQKFQLFLQQIDINEQLKTTNYVPLSDSDLIVSSALLQQIPFENRLTMSFARFEQQTAQQQEVITLSKQFCDSMMREESRLVILSGKAGIGKTAAAVCAAKELVSRKKNIVWISEVTVKGWADQAQSMADLSKCETEVTTLLNTEPDAVFLDDDNLTAYCGTMLLEKIYQWYVTHPDKGLFITSNETISFKNCYGYKLDGEYLCPPFTPYTSKQFLNQRIKINLSGSSLRRQQDGSSIGAIVSLEDYKSHEHLLTQVEYIPAVDYDQLISMRQSMHKTGSPGPTHDTLRPIERAWLHTYSCGGHVQYSRSSRKYIAPWTNIGVSHFEKTSCKTIVLEIGQHHSPFSGKRIISDCINQLVRVLNYAHDQGSRRVILINLTDFDHEAFLKQIQLQLCPKELERTWSRLTCLLSETATSIFQYAEFNYKITKIPVACAASLVNAESLVRKASPSSRIRISQPFNRHMKTTSEKKLDINSLTRLGLHKRLSQGKSHGFTVKKQDIDIVTLARGINVSISGTDSGNLTDQARLSEYMREASSMRQRLFQLQDKSKPALDRAALDFLSMDVVKDMDNIDSVSSSYTTASNVHK